MVNIKWAFDKKYVIVYDNGTVWQTDNIDHMRKKSSDQTDISAVFIKDAREITGTYKCYTPEMCWWFKL